MPNQPPHILCVDSSADLCAFYLFSLSRAGYKVTAVHSLAAAQTLIAQERFDLYVLESYLPDGDGLELCRAIRARDATTPIIFYTSAGRLIDRQNALGAGAQAYLVKPDLEKEFERLVKRLLGGQEQRVEAGRPS